MAPFSFSDVIDAIKGLEHFRSYTCSACGYLVRYHVLQIATTCPQCGAQSKVRGFGSIGTELQDVIDAVLEWAGEGEQFEAVMARHRSIVSNSGHYE